MFCPLFFNIPIFDKLAAYILQLDEFENQQSNSSRNRFSIKLDSKFTPASVSLTPKNFNPNRTSFLLKGSGRSLANSQLIQDKSYFEVKVIKTGTVSIGVSRSEKDNLDCQVGSDENSWGSVFGKDSDLTVGSVISCLFDQSDMPVLLTYRLDNLKVKEVPVSSMRSPIVPAVGVDDGAEVEVVFDSRLFEYTPPAGFSPIIFSQNFMF